MEPRADLHIHSTASDGMLTPAEVVRAGSRAGLAALSITDHDTVAGLDEAISTGLETGVEVVPGIEITTVYRGKVEAHILGYNIDHRSPRLVGFLDVLISARYQRGRKMVEQLNKAGVPVTFERVLEIAGGGAVCRPHVARALCEVRAVSSMDAAFGRFLRVGGVAYVPRHEVSPEEAVRVIVDAGGVAACAHVAKLNRDELVNDLIKHGLQAIEVYHPDHGSAGVRFYKRFAEARGLIATGGSDAHGYANGKRTEIGAVTVPYDTLERIRTASGKAGG